MHHPGRMLHTFVARSAAQKEPSGRGEIPKVEEPKATKMEPKVAKMTPRGPQSDQKYRVLGNKMSATNGTTKKKYLDNTTPHHATRSLNWNFNIQSE